MTRQHITTVVTDLDNTLWDWVDIWNRSFSALRDVVLGHGGVAPEDFDSEARTIHQRHGTSEYALLLGELPSLMNLSADDRRSVVEDAIAASQQARKASLTLYPGVVAALTEMRDRGCLVVAYTESMAFYTAQRIRKLGLDGILHYLYSSPDHDFPKHTPPKTIRRFSAEHYRLKQTEHRHTPAGVVKPNADVLISILTDLEVRRDGVVYVGDSLMKDVAMAQEANITDVWAKYGAAQGRAEYGLLRRVTHWSDEDVKREEAISRGGIVTPSYVLEEGFGEILRAFTFGPDRPAGEMG